MEQNTLRRQIERLDNVPTIPVMVRRLLEMFENPRISLKEIGDFISKDPVLASKILRVVNSPIYGFPGRISSLTQGLLLLGLNVVRGLLLGVALFEIMKEAVAGLWEHSIGCALMSRVLARRKGLKEPEEVFVAGLIHDLGKVFLSMRYPDLYRTALAQAEIDGLFIHEVETELFAANHAQVMGWVAEKWNFPKSLVEQVKYHHRPDRAVLTPVQTSIIHVADIMIRGRGFGFPGDQLVPPVNASAWDLLGLSDPLLREVLVETEDLLEQAEGFIVQEA
jgi:HD-like signal output (HDOD) protein